MKQTIIIRDPDSEPDPTPDPKVETAVGLEKEQGVGVKAGRVGALKCMVSLGCALTVDGLQWLIPPLWFVWDGAMVLALFLIWGWRWEIAIAVIPEAIPGVDLFPTWTVFVGYLIAVRRKK